MPGYTGLKYDQDANGSISKQEATVRPGIATGWNRYDTNSDNLLTSDELETRFRKWSEEDTGMMNVRAEVTWNGKPLEGAHVQLTPMPFLGNQFHAASGDTDRYGFTFLSIDKKELLSSQQGIFGMQIGLYHVEITHPQIQLPDRYNVKSELGVDLSPAESNSGIAFHLRK